MKKILLSFCMAACALFATAKDYTDELIVTVDDQSTPAMEATVTVEEGDGKIAVLLKNFTLSMPGADPIPVGNIYVPELGLTAADGYDSFAAENKAVTVTAGEPADAGWFGPIMFANGLDINISGKVSDTKLYCELDLTFGEGESQQIIHVTFGTDDFTSSVLSAKAGDPDKLVDVYTILGVQAKSQVKKSQALDGLQRGIYIVDGKKVIKR